jgi:hypothetical protein
LAIKSIPPFIHLSIEYFDKLPGRYSQNLYAIPWLGKKDFEAIKTIANELYFRTAMGLDELPSEPILRQRMNKQAEVFLPLVENASLNFLINSQPTLMPMSR